LNSYINLLGNLKTISEKELNSTELSDSDYDTIRSIGDILDSITFGIDEDGRKTTLVADVHTNSHPNEMKCVEEGVGYIDYVAVCVKVGGEYKTFLGPVFSYYEFKQPIGNRLSDPDWKIKLDFATPPERPEWIGTFAA